MNWLHTWVYRWRALERYERRKKLVHTGLLTWLSHAVVREWHVVTELDLSFFILAVLIELEEHTRGKVYAWPNRSNSTSYGGSRHAPVA